MAEALLIFYDGNCGLCHHTVRFVLAKDRSGEIRFAPIDSRRFRELVPESQRSALPDSVIVRRADGTLRIRSDSMIEIGLALGGVWSRLASALRVIPRGLRDSAYDFVARVRHRLFKRPDAACPILPPELRARFDD